MTCDEERVRDIENDIDRIIGRIRGVDLCQAHAIRLMNRAGRLGNWFYLRARKKDCP